MADDRSKIDEALLKVQEAIESVVALSAFEREWVDTPGWAESARGQEALIARLEATRREEAYAADPSEANAELLNDAERGLIRAEGSAKQLAVSRKDETNGLRPTDLPKIESLLHFALNLLGGRVNPADPSRLRRVYAILEENDTSRRVRALEHIAAARARLESVEHRRVGEHMSDAEYDGACLEIFQNLRAELSWFVDGAFGNATPSEIGRHLRDKRKGNGVEQAVAAELSLATGAFGDVSAPGESHADAIHRISGRYSAAHSTLTRT